MIMKYYKGSMVFTLICLALAAWLGWSLTGNVGGTLEVLWLVAVLAVLEVSLSFDNAVVNATVLRDMDDIWRRRFPHLGHGHRGLRHADRLSAGHRRHRGLDRAGRDAEARDHRSGRI